MCLSNIKDTYLEFPCSNQKFEEVFNEQLKSICICAHFYCYKPESQNL